MVTGVDSAANGSGLRDELARGATLPASWYSSSEILAAEKELVFRKSWHYAGHLGQLGGPGDYFTCAVADIPVVVVRDEQAQLRAFVNTCRHRGTEVARGSGCARGVLQCHYHGWTYALDGSLKTAPRADREATIDRGELGLLPLRVDVCGPLIFVSPDPDAPPLDDEFAALFNADLGDLDPASLVFHSGGEWEIEANWKVLAENFLECYHCPIAHPGFTDLFHVDPDSYANRAQGRVLSLLAPLRELPTVGRPRARRAVLRSLRGGASEASFFLLWPNTTINVLPGPSNLFVLGFNPITPDRTRGFQRCFVAPGTDEARLREMTDFFAAVGEEDTALSSRYKAGYAPGRCRMDA